MEQLLTNNVAAIVMAGGFLWYLNRRDTRSQERDKNFTEVLFKMTKKLEKLTDVINNMQDKCKNKQ